MRQASTATRSFGTSTRVGHDSSKFYTRNMCKAGKSERDSKTTQPENIIPSKKLNKIYCQSSEAMTQLPDNSVHLMVTSPPYNVGKDYDEDLSKDDFRGLLRSVWQETYRVLAPGGRACINVANIGRKPYIPLNSMITQDMLDIGFLMRGEIIWNKAASAGTSCAWGSWCSPSNPVLRDVHEYILVFSKGSFSRNKPTDENKEPTINKDEFMEFTKSIWSFQTASARKIGHPAPYPVELPRRFMELYTYKGDVVLDPFMGSGTTAIAALSGDRHYVGYELSRKYKKMAENRIAQL